MKLWVGKQPGCDTSTIQAAVDLAERQPPDKTAIIYIHPGVYEEMVRIDRSNLALIGLGEVVIRMNRHAMELNEAGEAIGTFATPTLFLGGSRLVLERLTIENTAGPGGRVGQALAVYAHCDLTVFRHCRFKGQQDTLFTGPLPPYPLTRAAFGGLPLREHHLQYRQFYHQCRIEGNVDFIFGGATAYFEGCEIHSVARLNPVSPGYITAASTPSEQAAGYVFSKCRLSADPEVEKGSVFLGRPWREYAATAFVNCEIGEHIHPQGWDPWDDSGREETVRYGEYGLGARADGLRATRVAWAACCECGEEAWSRPCIFGEADGFFRHIMRLAERGWTFENDDAEHGFAGFCGI